MQGITAPKVLGILGWIAAVLYLGIGVLELVLADDSFGHRALFFAVLCGLALLVLAGTRMIASRPWPGAALASVGAILGGFALFWTGLAIALAVAIVVLSVICARRVSAAAPATA